MFYRMCWRYWDGTELHEGCGEWRSGTKGRQKVEASVKFGEAHIGAGTHWLETAGKEAEDA